MATQGKPKMILAGMEVQDGDVLDSLYRRHHDGIRRYIARAFGAGPPDPVDAVQAAFERYAALDDPGAVDNPRAFLMRSARNFVIDQHRRQAVRSSYQEKAEPIGDASDELDGERVLLAKERWTIIEQTILALDERRREVLIMNRLHGLSCAEIARVKGYSATLVKNLVSQALLACERALREADGE